MSSTTRLVRTRGIEAPYNKDQIAAFVLHPIISIVFVVLSALSTSARTLGFVLVPFVLLSALVAGLWGYVSWADPAGEGGYALRRKGFDTPHYCSFCRKTVKGFDHHCTWLNTCISSRNYVHFYLLGVSGSLLYGYMVAIGILVQFLVDEDDLRDGFGSLVAGRWSWGIFDVMSGWIAFSFVALAGFHSYLLCIGMGTYDWVVLQGQKRQQELARRRSGGRNRPKWTAVLPCCRAKRPRATRHAAVQDVNGVGGGRPSSWKGGAGGVRGSGSWGGIDMGAGAVTPTRNGMASVTPQRLEKLSSAERVTGGLSASPSVSGEYGTAVGISRATPVP